MFWTVNLKEKKGKILLVLVNTAIFAATATFAATWFQHQHFCWKMLTFITWINPNSGTQTPPPTTTPNPTPTRIHALCCGRHSLSVKCIVWRWSAPVKPTQCGQHRAGRGWSQGPPPAPQWNPQPLHARLAHLPTMERVRLTPATPRRLAFSVRLILGIDIRLIAGNHSEV